MTSAPNPAVELDVRGLRSCFQPPPFAANQPSRCTPQSLTLFLLAHSARPPMNLLRFVTLVVAGAFSSACASTWPDTAPKVCPKHHEELQSRIMFAVPKGTNIDPSDHYLDVATGVEDEFPYVVPFSLAQRRTPDFPLRRHLRFCPVCERGMKAALAEHRK